MDIVDRSGFAAFDEREPAFEQGIAYGDYLSVEVGTEIVERAREGGV